MSVISKIFGTHSEREVKKLNPLLDKIDSLSDKYKAITSGINKLPDGTGSHRIKIAWRYHLDQCRNNEWEK